MPSNFPGSSAIEHCFYLSNQCSGANHPLGASRVWASIGHMIALAVEADDKHGTPVAIAIRLVRGDDRSVSAFWRDIAHPFAETSVAEFVGTTKKFDGIVGVIRSQPRLHGAEVLVAKS